MRIAPVATAALSQHAVSRDMKPQALWAAAALAATALQAGAVALPGSSFDDVSSTYFFDVKRIGAGDTFFNFVFEPAGGETGLQYRISGDISATNFSLTSVTLNGTPFSLQPTAGGNFLGVVGAITGSPLEVEITGTFTGAPGSYGNLQGSLVLAPVPEPETYALMLAGLAAVGFAARRRRVH